MTVRHEVLEHARFLTELSVIDYFFVAKLSANVGLAALLNAMDICRTCLFASRADFFYQLGSLEGFDLDDPEIEECRERLRDLYEQGGYAANGVPALGHEEEMETEQRTATISPVSVAFAFNNQGQVPSEYYGTACPTNQATRTVSDSSASYGEIYYGAK
jgi:lipoyl(octanoyl) transferase